MAGTSPAMTKMIQSFFAAHGLLRSARTAMTNAGVYARTAASPGTVANPALLA